MADPPCSLRATNKREGIMATSPIDLRTTSRHSRIGVSRLGVAGALTAAVVFVLCWLSTFLPFGSPTHAYISLFTNAPITSVAALVEGGFWSALFGALLSGLFALIYIAASVLERR
jgi:hypothetical protein